MNYRSDIDGLRAIAILPVIFSHAGFSVFAGGFVGVDVFFVISGYLIASILRRDLAAGLYSIAGFYERRARRIMPALLLVMLVMTPFAWHLMLPDFRQNYGQSVVATLLFSNNILLSMTAGYWDLESGFKPLLHTWSLGVEEQFYIVFPLLIALIWKYSTKAQLCVIFGLVAFSFALAEYGWRTSPSTNFYLSTSRAWELLIGCAACYYRRSETAQDNMLSLTGFVMIITAILGYGELTPSPSYYMLLPVVGTVLVLMFSRPGTVAYRILSLPFMVGIGLISYSAYLWHQPIFAVTRLNMFEPPPLWLMFAMSLLALILAWLTWRYVEIPFRSKNVSLPAFSAGVITASAVLLAIGLGLHMGQGFPRTVFPKMAASSDVYISYNERIRQFDLRTFSETTLPKVLVIGDSFGRDVANTLIETGAMDTGGLVYNTGRWDESSPEFEAQNELLAQADVVVFTLHSKPLEQAWQQLESIRAVSDAKIFVFGSKDFGYNPNPYARVPAEQRAALRSPVPADVLQYNADAAALLAQTPYSFVDSIGLLSEDGSKIAVFNRDGNPLSPDRIHLTKYGAVLLSERLRTGYPDLIAAIRPVTR